MKQYYCFLTLFTCCLLAVQSTQVAAAPDNNAVSQDPSISPATPSSVAEDFTVFPVGLNIGNRNIIPSILVRGKEDGEKAINFENWLIPYDAVIQGLNIDVKSLPEGQLELRSPGLVIRIDPNRLANDPELGLVFSIQQLQTLLGVPAEFNITQYAVVLNPPWLGKTTESLNPTQIPVQLEGLPKIKAREIEFSGVEQRLSSSGTPGTPPTFRGEMAAVGTVLYGGWYARVDQQDITDSRTWNLAEAQYLFQSDRADYALGSQPSFWRSENANDYWGFTTIHRQKFTPPVQFEGGGFVPNQRLQAGLVGRTIVGRAEPGTIVRLTQGLSDRPIAEVLVDSSGIYRFEDIPVGGLSFGGNYRVLLYPQGRLTAQPEIRTATFTNIPGQIPKGASATIVSAGFDRQSLGRENSNFLGEFGEFQGGIAQRWGVSETLTLGVGGIYDTNIKGLGEIFFRPNNFPLELSTSILSANQSGNWDVNTDLRLEPTRNVTSRLNIDKFATRFNVDWRIFRNLTLLGTYNTREGAATGLQTSFAGKGYFTFASATIDEKQRVRWFINQRYGLLSFQQQGNEIGTTSELDYSLSGQVAFDSGHSLLLTYETRNLNGFDDLATLGWRYRSQQRAVDGRYLWETQLGYGVGSQGSGPVAVLQTAAIPGLLLRGRYEGGAVTSSQDTYSLEIISSFNLQQGLFPGDRKINRFRSEGGLLIQPFFDQNNNGQRDAGEKVYTENAELLLILNNSSIKSMRPEIQRDRILMRLPPGVYRLDFDPAGFPIDWQVNTDSYAVDVVAGSYTPIVVPLNRAYTISGVVTDATGNAIAGARVEAIALKSGQRTFSVTNGAGVYYLERLQQDTYKLEINGQPAKAQTINLNETTPSLQEINLQQ